MPRRKPRPAPSKDSPLPGPPARAGEPEEELQGPPARETTVVRSDRERAATEGSQRHNETSPTLSGGDVDADWQRAAHAGDEAVGGTVATPDQDLVDVLGEALGVPQAPDAEVRASAEILEARDRQRWEQEP